jgi:Spy/CpxP family protein refolding chaperone
MGQRGMGQKGMGAQQNCRMAEFLNLTDNQIDKFQEMRIDHMKDVEKYRSEIRQNMLDIKKMLNADDIDREAITSLTDKNYELRGKIRNSAQSLWFDLYDNLNTEQKELWSDFVGNKGFGPFGKGMMGRSHKVGNWNCPGGGKAYNHGYRHRGRGGYGPGKCWDHPRAPKWNN